MNTEKLISFVQVKEKIGQLPLEITGIQTDSRKVEEGNVFVCISGYTVDGHDYIDKALEKGAKLIVIEKDVELKEGISYIKVSDTNRTVATLANVFYDFPSANLNIVGITGTNGKTTVSTLIHQILMKENIKAGLSGTAGINYNGRKEESANTTNDSLTVQKMLKTMKDEGITDVVMEVSSHGLMLGRLLGVEFQQGVFTNLTQDHLDFHETMDKYAQAKGLLFAQLGQNMQKNKTAILNNDDATSQLYQEMTGARVITYGIEKESDYMATDIDMKPDYTRFKLKTAQGNYEITTPLVGKFNVYNLLSAIAVLVGRGIDIKDIVEHVKTVQTVDGRMERVINDKKRAVFVDYAHTPDGIEKVLQSVRPFTKGKVMIVFGCGGNRDKEKRPVMAKAASEYADLVILTTDNPRMESPDDIMNDIRKGITKNNSIEISDRKEAIVYAVENSTEDDVVIIAGKGHEEYQIIGKVKYPFSDKMEVMEALSKL